MNIVIGANGLVGLYLVAKLLNEGEEVTCLVRSQVVADELHLALQIKMKVNLATLAKIKYVHANILDYPKLEECFGKDDHIYHLAALVSFNEQDKTLLFETNIEGTANVVNAALEKKVKVLAYISSVAALGRQNNQTIVTEDHDFIHHNKNSNYAISKYYAELEVWRGKEEGLNIVVVNPTIILGYAIKGQSSASIFTKVKNKFKFTSDGVNGFVAAEDVANCLYLLVTKKIFNHRFILNGENMSYSKLFSLIANEMNLNFSRYLLKRWMKWPAIILAKIWSLITQKTPFISAEIIETALANNQYSNAKITAAIAYDFMPIEKAVKNTVNIMS